MKLFNSIENSIYLPFAAPSFRALLNKQTGKARMEMPCGGGTGWRKK